jgi:hypothetical protein
MRCIYGGTPGVRKTLRPCPPPSRVCRVIAGSVWWPFIHWPWKRFRAAVASAVAGAKRPTLASVTNPKVWFTDPESLEGCESPSDFAIRLALNFRAQAECSLYGCVVIEFAVPQNAKLLNPPAAPGFLPGLTGCGAREWLLDGNVPLDESMTVYCVENAGGVARHYQVPL